MADAQRGTADPGSEVRGVRASNKSAWFTEVPAIESILINGRRLIVYSGTSMDRTLREPDLLRVEPYGTRAVRAGDVVCYKSSGKNVIIVHRVVSVGVLATGGSKNGIRTRGDNSSKPDAEVLAADDLLGQVVSAQSGSRRRPIQGGVAGRMIARSARLRRAVWRVVADVLSFAYQGLVRRGPFDSLLPGRLKPRPVCFGGAATLKLLMGRRTVGHYDCDVNRWCIRRPFRLFVDERSLITPQSPPPDPNNSPQPASFCSSGEDANSALPQSKARTAGR
jgi:signal peptidase I